MENTPTSATSEKKTSAFSANGKTPDSTPVMQSFKSSKNEPSGVKVLAVLLVMALLGVGTGYAVASFTGSSSTKSGNEEKMANSVSPDNPKKGETYGNGDEAVFKDTAEGILKEGGIEGEGQYHLERPGGESQNVYMTSSSVDLSKFINMKIKVWGQTQTAQHAGWLMDVGKVQVL